MRTRLEKLASMRGRGIDPYPARFRRTATTRQAVARLLRLEAGKGGGGVRTRAVAVAGRVMARRALGGAAFVDLQDGEGRIQAHLRSDLLGESFALLDDIDLGDFLGVRGPVFRTRRGEPSVEAKEVRMLAKAVRPLPDKWSGLQDVEKRYRQRYLDLITNEGAVKIARTRAAVVASMRRFLNGRGFMEVETPVLVPVAAGAMARPFVTRHNALDRTLYLRIATELPLKKLIIGGIEKVYEIGRIFRNEGIDLEHNPEFTTLESYEAYADYADVMK
ncbi:MAG: lysine--tRNA ligase, partial [Gemmatimonadetes bacterium]|nr:lysine--tRNA ligase [Gemmatimonadota bacterium]